VSMTNPSNRVEVNTSIQRRRRWTGLEKVRMVEGTFEPGMTVSLVARQHGVAPNQLFTWRRLVTQGSLTAAGSGEEVVPASQYRALQNQVRELHRLLGKKTLEAEILKEASEHARPTITRFTPTKLSDIVRPANSSQLAEVPDRVRPFRGYNRAAPVTGFSGDGFSHLLVNRLISSPMFRYRLVDDAAGLRQG
jgi:transposase